MKKKISSKMAKEDFDFEKYWLAKFSKYLKEIAGINIHNGIMKGCEGFSDNSNREEIIKWSKKAIEKLDSLVDEEKRIKIMTGCACQYPKYDLQEIRKKYGETKDIDLVHQMLLEKFILFLKDSLKLDTGLVKDIINRGWGLAGVKKGNTIIATKIPKSGNLTLYMKEHDPEKKRALYCHCPRVRDVLKTPDIKISPTYCYCGAGFYKGIWEEILERPVKVKVLKTVMKEDDTCQIAIYLPI